MTCAGHVGDVVYLSPDPGVFAVGWTFPGSCGTAHTHRSPVRWLTCSQCVSGCAGAACLGLGEARGPTRKGGSRLGDSHCPRAFPGRSLVPRESQAALHPRGPFSGGVGGGGGCCQSPQGQGSVWVLPLACGRFSEDAASWCHGPLTRDGGDLGAGVGGPALTQPAADDRQLLESPVSAHIEALPFCAPPCEDPRFCST